MLASFRDPSALQLVAPEELGRRGGEKGSKRKLEVSPSESDLVDSPHSIEGILDDSSAKTPQASLLSPYLAQLTMEVSPRSSRHGSKSRPGWRGSV